MRRRTGRKTKKTNFFIVKQREIVIFIIILFILYIVCFSGIFDRGKRWKENAVDSNYIRTSTSYGAEDDNASDNVSENVSEDDYLFKEGIVDTMQEKALMYAANKNNVRKRLTNASKGIGVSNGIEVDGKKIEFVDRTRIDDETIQLSYTDYEVLQRIVEAEATGLDEKSKILVANVLFNRVRSAEFPNTIEEVVFERVNGVVQFQPTSDGRYEKVQVKDDTITAVNKAISGVDYSRGALYFLARSGSRKSSITWFDQNLTWLFEYEGHEFYK